MISIVGGKAQFPICTEVISVRTAKPERYSPRTQITSVARRLTRDVKTHHKNQKELHSCFPDNPGLNCELQKVIINRFALRNDAIQTGRHTRRNKYLPLIRSLEPFVNILKIVAWKCGNPFVNSSEYYLLQSEILCQRSCLSCSCLSKVLLTMGPINICIHRY